jgi:hypothetical protein
MITVFTIPKAFQGRAKIQQRNAIASWKAIDPTLQVILVGNDAGVREAAEEFGCLHAANVKCTPQGTPRLDSAFEIASARADWPLLLYVNSDIIFLADLLRLSQYLSDEREFLACGSRIDLDVEEELDWSNPTETQRSMRTRASEHGVRHAATGSDYFCFRRNTVTLPPFAVGRAGWDNWLIYWAHDRGWPVIDASDAISVIHQNHDYSHSVFGARTRVVGPEFDHNIRLAGGYHRMLDLRAANRVMAAGGVTRPPLFRAITASILSHSVTRRIIGAKRAAFDAWQNRRASLEVSIGR